MGPAYWGLLTALTWGTADFIARFTGRAMGHNTALVGMFLMSAVAMTALSLVLPMEFVWVADSAWTLMLASVGIMTGTLLLYWGLARGPVTVVAPIVGSYPAINLAISLLVGERPSATQWVLMAAVILGVLVVARASKSFEDGVEHTSVTLRKTVLISCGSAVAFAIGIVGAQQATLTFGEWQTVLVVRWMGFALGMLILLGQTRRLPRISIRWAPLLMIQGLLDGAAYLCLVLGGQGLEGVLTVVVASTFSVVTVLLARVFLAESMTLSQWGGIVLIVGGVSALTAVGA